MTARTSRNWTLCVMLGAAIAGAAACDPAGSEPSVARRHRSETTLSQQSAALEADAGADAGDAGDAGLDQTP